MQCYGLTGGIASGKSTVATMFRALGAHIIDADDVYHTLIQPLPRHTPSPVAKRIADQFPGVLQDNGQIDRAILGKRVFADVEQRKRLEQITHPAVAQAVAEQIAALDAQGVELVLYDVPLLYERKLEKSVQGVIVVWVPRAMQLQRLQQRDGLSPTAAEQRLAAQLPIDEKKQRADWIIDNSSTHDATREQVERIWHTLSSSPRRRGSR